MTKGLKSNKIMVYLNVELYGCASLNVTMSDRILLRNA